jgi:hypothetical protein
MSKNRFAALALASAFALITALPAAAADKPAKPAGTAPQVTTSRHSGGRMVLKSSSRVRVQRQHGAQRPGFFAAAAEECSFDCGDWTVTCSGESAACSDSACIASGGDTTIIAWCEED